jgi:serine/threonine protein kinase
VVHRDVKPDNLFLTAMGGQEDFVKVLDFGVATMIGGGSPALTQEGFGIGTPSYFPPELIMSKPVDARADVYSLGCVLYFLLTGRPPFVEKDVRALLLAHLRKHPTPPSERLSRSLPRDVEAVVLKCLEKDPNERYRDGGEVAEAIQACIERRRARILSAVEEPMRNAPASAAPAMDGPELRPSMPPRPSRPSEPRVERVAPSMYRVHGGDGGYDDQARTSVLDRTPDPVPLVTRRESAPPMSYEEEGPTDIERQKGGPLLDGPSRRVLRRVAG